MPSTRNTTDASTAELSQGAWGISAAAFGRAPLFSTAHTRRVLERMIMEQGSMPELEILAPEIVPTPATPQPRFVRIVPVTESTDTSAHYRIEIVRGETVEDWATEISEANALRLASRLREEYLPSVRNSAQVTQLSGNRIARSMRPSLSRLDRRSVRPEDDVVSEDGLNIPELNDEPGETVQDAVTEEPNHFDDFDEELDF